MNSKLKLILLVIACYSCFLFFCHADELLNNSYLYNNIPYQGDSSIEVYGDNNEPSPMMFNGEACKEIFELSDESAINSEAVDQYSNHSGSTALTTTATSSTSSVTKATFSSNSNSRANGYINNILGANGYINNILGANGYINNMLGADGCISNILHAVTFLSTITDSNELGNLPDLINKQQDNQGYQWLYNEIANAPQCYLGSIDIISFFHALLEKTKMPKLLFSKILIDRATGKKRMVDLMPEQILELTLPDKNTGSWNYNIEPVCLQNLIQQKLSSLLNQYKTYVDNNSLGGQIQSTLRLQPPIPSTLIISINRLNRNNSKCNENQRAILSLLGDEDILKFKTVNEEIVSYKPMAILCDKGNSLQGEHYITLCRNSGVWQKFDNGCTTLAAKDDNKQAIKNCYLIICKRVFLKPENYSEGALSVPPISNNQKKTLVINSSSNTGSNTDYKNINPTLIALPFKEEREQVTSPAIISRQDISYSNLLFLKQMLIFMNIINSEPAQFREEKSLLEIFKKILNLDTNTSVWTEVFSQNRNNDIGKITYNSQDDIQRILLKRESNKLKEEHDNSLISDNPNAPIFSQLTWFDKEQEWRKMVNQAKQKSLAQTNTQQILSENEIYYIADTFAVDNHWTYNNERLIARMAADRAINIYDQAQPNNKYVNILAREQQVEGEQVNDKKDIIEAEAKWRELAMHEESIVSQDKDACEIAVENLKRADRAVNSLWFSTYSIIENNLNSHKAPNKSQLDDAMDDALRVIIDEDKDKSEYQFIPEFEPSQRQVFEKKWMDRISKEESNEQDHLNSTPVTAKMLYDAYNKELVRLESIRKMTIAKIQGAADSYAKCREHVKEWSTLSEEQKNYHNNEAEQLLTKLNKYFLKSVVLNSTNKGKLYNTNSLGSFLNSIIAHHSHNSNNEDKDKFKNNIQGATFINEKIWKENSFYWPYLENIYIK